MLSVTQAERLVHDWPPARLHVIYDDQCELCRRCRHWLSTQSTHVELCFLPSSHPEVSKRYGQLSWFEVELMVVDDYGRAWIGPQAFIMALWATRRWRSMSYKLSGTAFTPLAERFFHGLTSNRSTVSAMLGPHRCESDSCER